MPNDAKWGDENCDWEFFRAVHERMRADDEEVFRQNMFKVKLHDDEHVIIFSLWKRLQDYIYVVANVQIQLMYTLAS